MWRQPYHYMHQTCLLYTITALCNVSLALDKIFMESSCCCCCCCCGSGDRDRDFCIYKNLFLAVVWIVLVSVSPIFYFDPRSAGQVSFPDGWTSFVFWLGYTNSSINPFIYAVKFKEFRPAFRDSLRWILCRSGTSRPDAPRWTSTNTNINFKVKYFLL